MNKHSEEINAIIAASAARTRDRKLDGKALAAERRACSKVIAEACARHRAEANESEAAA